MGNEKIKYTFTRHSSYAAPATMDQDNKLVERDMTVKFWTAVKCFLSLKHFVGGVFQCENGNWHCRRCNRRVSMLKRRTKTMTQPIEENVELLPIKLPVRYDAMHKEIFDAGNVSIAIFRDYGDEKRAANQANQIVTALNTRPAPAKPDADVVGRANFGKTEIIVRIGDKEYPTTIDEAFAKLTIVIDDFAAENGKLREALASLLEASRQYELFGLRYGMDFDTQASADTYKRLSNRLGDAQAKAKALIDADGIAPPAKPS